MDEEVKTISVDNIIKHSTDEVFITITYFPLETLWSGLKEFISQNKKHAMSIYEDLLDYSFNEKIQKRLLAVILEYASIEDVKDEVNNTLWFALCKKWDINPYVASDVVRERIGGK